MPEILTATRVMTGDETIPNGAVVIGDRTFSWVGPVQALPAEYRTLPRADYPGSTIMPGLIDTHVHLGFDGGPDPVARMRAQTDGQQLALMLHNARQLLGVGVTTARDLGCRGYLSLAVRDAIAAGRESGPRLVVAASPITVPGGHCWFMGGAADSPDALRAIVRGHHEQGADLIKVMATGGVMTAGTSPGQPQFTSAQMSLIVEEAACAGKPVAAHAHSVEGISLAVEAGVASVEHCSFITGSGEAKFSESLAARMAERGTFACPTVNVNNFLLAKVTKIPFGAFAKAMHEQGVRIIAGTDAGVYKTPHDQYVGGLENFVTLGFRPDEVLAMATTEAAAALGLEGVTGRLVPGYDADLIVVAGDPLAGIDMLSRLRRVVARGRDYLPDSGRLGRPSEMKGEKGSRSDSSFIEV